MAKEGTWDLEPSPTRESNPTSMHWKVKSYAGPEKSLQQNILSRILQNVYGLEIHSSVYLDHKKPGEEHPTPDAEHIRHSATQL